MKDAAWLRYASGRRLATFDPEISEWGNPSDFVGNAGLDACEQTWGSKTFQYPEEKRLISISLVAASEREEAQTQPYFWGVEQSISQKYSWGL